jgi:rod shape determining protein RodA
MRADLSWLDRLTRLDWVFTATVLLLTGLGCLFIYSASYELQTRALFVKQLVWCVIGLSAFMTAALFDYRLLFRMNKWIYWSTAAALVFVLFFGKSVYGARRWINLAGFQIQPSEPAKLSLVIMLAALLGDPARDPSGWRTMGLCAAAAALPFVLIAAEPDLGTAMVLIPLLWVMLFCGGAPLKPLLLTVAAGVLLLTVTVLWLKFQPDSFPLLEDYQKNRILVFLNLNDDPLGAGWNKMQSAIAVGSGGWSGKGFLNGTQNMLGFLPRKVAPTDFIFSVIAEETGFRGGAVLLGLFSLLLYRAVRAAVRARDVFGRILAAGLAALVFCHVFVNVAMTVGVLPITGLPLPLISYGGSFMVSMMIAMGLVQSVYVRRRIHG